MASSSPEAASTKPTLLTRVRHPSTPEPSGCRWCGAPQRGHGSSFVRSVGLHVFIAPTGAQRLARMRARRAAHSG